MDETTLRDDEGPTEIGEVAVDDNFGFEPGELLGDYRIERPLGRGGMGVVFEAVHPVIGKRAAIKVLKKELCRDRKALQRFVDEARAVNQIGHPNVVDIFSFGECLGGRSYFVMELLEGETLRTRMDREITYAELAAIFKPLARALGAAHAKGVVHRDLKPENVILAEVTDEAPRVKLLDFGIAKLLGTANLMGETASGEMVGTPMYIAPEQARGKPADPRSDIYSLGAMLFEVAVGRPPFWANNVPDMLLMHVRETPPLARALNPRVPAALEAILVRMLGKSLEARPSLDELIAVLSDVEQLPGSIDPPIAMRPAIETPLATSIPIRGPRSSALTTASRPPSSRLRLIVIAAATVAVTVAAFVIVRVNRSSTTVPVDAAVMLPAPLDAAVVVTPIEPDAPPAPSVGMLELTGLPSTARIRIDGQDVTGTRIELAPGQRKLDIAAHGYFPETRVLEIRAGQTLALPIQLRKNYGRP